MMPDVFCSVLICFLVSVREENLKHAVHGENSTIYISVEHLSFTVFFSFYFFIFNFFVV